MSQRDQCPILIAGPTASGKSALALRIAAEVDGVIVNADSMQVYRELHVLSARPSAADEGLALHDLYGHVAASEAYSVGRYVVDVMAALVRAQAMGKRPILVGGTGLYFKVLLEGLSPIPEIAVDVRAHWRATAAAIGAPMLHAILAERDPVMAVRLSPSDTQRITRALEVLDATGKSLAYWQLQPGVPILRANAVVRLVVRPDRDVLVRRCDHRFDLMMQQGALEEVQALMALQLDPVLPAMGAIGVRSLAAHLAGQCALADAVEQAKLETRQYVKRQLTWLKRNMITWNEVQKDDIESNDRSIRNLIDCCVAKG